MGSVRFRSVVEELEAHLVPTPGYSQTKARGKAEWKVYADGSRKAKVSLSNLSVIDGTVIELSVAGRPLTELIVHRGSARYRKETEQGDDVPVVVENEVLQVSNLGKVLLEGRFVPE